MYHQNETAERSVLGTIIAEGSQAYAIASEHIMVGTAFTLRDRRVIWELLGHMVREGLPIEATSVYSTAQAVRAIDLDERLPDAVAGELIDIAELSQVTGALVSPTTLGHQARLVSDAWKRRGFLQAVTVAADEAKTPGCTPEAILGKISQFWRRIQGGMAGSRSLSDIVGDSSVQTYHPAGSWGVPQLDSLAPLMSSRNYVLAAAPGMGKSTLGLQANLASAALGYRSVFLSMEMDASDFKHRAPILADACGYDAECLDLVSILEEPGGVPVARIPAIFEKAEADGASFVVVDYLGQFKKSSPWQKDFDKVTECSNAIAEATKRTGVASITLCQMTRESRAQRQSKSGELEGMNEPHMGALRGSGDIEQDANWIGILWNPDRIPGGEPEAELALRVCKDRHSGTGGQNIPLRWLRSKYRFTSRAVPVPQANERFEQAPTDDEDLFA